MTPHIYVRYPDRGEWYARFKVRGKAYLWNTKTTEKPVAKVRAKNYRDAIVAGAYHLASTMKSGNDCPTFEQLTESYLTLAIPAAPRTRKNNVSSLWRVLAASGLGPKDRVDRLGAVVATTYQSKCAKTSPGAIGIDAHSMAISCNSRLRQARSLFSKRAMAFYPQSFGLPKERIAEFIAVPLMPVGERQRPLPSPEAMAAAENAKTGLPAIDAACWSAYLLAKYTGMRPSEIKVARWDWLQENLLMVGGFDGVATTKTKRFRAIRLDPAIVATLVANKSSEEYIVSGNPKHIIERRLVPMLRAFGFTMVDPLYALRRWHASWRYQYQGSSEAQHTLGHTTPSTTMRHYARMIDAPAAIPLGGGAVVTAPTGPAVPSQ